MGAARARARARQRHLEMEKLGVKPSPAASGFSGVGSKRGQHGYVGQLEFYSSSSSAAEAGRGSPRRSHSPISVLSAIGFGASSGTGGEKGRAPAILAAAAAAEGTTIVRPVPRWLLPYQQEVVTTLLLLLTPLSLWGAACQLQTLDDAVFVVLTLGVWVTR